MLTDIDGIRTVSTARHVEMPGAKPPTEVHLSERHRLTIRRILKVNHAGEYGAIRIYRAQLCVIGSFFRDLEPMFRQMLAHEVSHCRQFTAAMPARDARPCRAMWFWGLGGYALGFLTAILGRNALMACTEAVENAVHRHMKAQVSFLKGRDEALKSVIEAIQVEELSHLRYAEDHLRPGSVAGIIRPLVYISTEAVIWLSTQGDVSRMEREMAADSREAACVS